MKDGEFIYVIVIAAASCLFVGWMGANVSVVNDCEKLGAVRIGDKAFECRRIEK